MKRSAGKRLWGCGLVWLLYVCVTVQSSEVSIQTLREQLKSSNRNTAEESLAELLTRGKQGKAAAVASLQSILARRRATYQRAVAVLVRPLRFLKNELRRRELQKALDKHDKAAKEAIALAFDDNAYPPPEKAFTGWCAGKDYQKGQILVEGSVEFTIKLYNKLESTIVNQFGQILRVMRAGGLGVASRYKSGTLKDSGRPIKVVKYGFTDGARQWKHIATAFEQNYKKCRNVSAEYNHARLMAKKAGIEDTPALPAVSRSAIAAGALFTRDYRQAAVAMPASGTIEGRIFDILVARHMMLLNEETTKEYPKKERQLLAMLNHYRLSLGLCPLRANVKIYAAAREHSSWQHDHKRMSHIRDEQGYHDCVERCKLQGYASAAGENISGRGGVSTLWGWRADALHHRNLIRADCRAGAVATVDGYTTYNVGRKIEDRDLNALIR